MVDVRSKANETIGGSSDTELKEFTAIPTTRPSTRAATTATPVGKPASAHRIACGVGPDLTASRTPRLTFTTIQCLNGEPLRFIQDMESLSVLQVSEEGTP